MSGTPCAGGQLDQRAQVVHARVHAAVGDEPEQVQPAGLARRRAGGAQHRFSANEPSATASSIRVRSWRDDRAGAEVEVADLGVAHLAVGQADGAAAGRELRCAGSAAQSSSKTGVSASSTALPGPGRRQPPAVEDHEADGGTERAGTGGTLIAAAAATIRAKLVRVEARAADQRAVDVRLGEDLRRVLRLDAAAVEDAHALGGLASSGRRPARGRSAIASCACSGVATLPVPIAQIGS